MLRRAVIGMGAPRAIQEDVRWPAAEAQALAAACAGLGELLDGQSPSRRRVGNRAQEEFRGNKSNDFALRFSTNNRNAESLVWRLHAMRTALAAAEQWAADEQAARVKARQEEDDRSWWGLEGLIEDLVS
ncbi:MAG TPA: hypothetical protein VK988_09075 [Acidimicrobiales bacterium]|nr:hypothetical protein [Acidimicrobiales bacterium]